MIRRTALGLGLVVAIFVGPVEGADDLKLVTIYPEVRKRLGGEWRVAEFLIRTLCRSAKCRAADDLVHLIERDPALADLRDELPGLSLRDRIRLILYTNCATSALAFRHGCQQPLNSRTDVTINIRSPDQRGVSQGTATPFHKFWRKF